MIWSGLWKISGWRFISFIGINIDNAEVGFCEELDWPSGTGFRLVMLVDRLGQEGWGHIPPLSLLARPL